jgi:hypothetical protein
MLSADPSGRLDAGVAGSNPAWDMDVCLLCLYVVLSCIGRGLCDGLITRPEESYRVYKCVWLRNLKREAKAKLKGSWSERERETEVLSVDIWLRVYIIIHTLIRKLKKRKSPVWYQKRS